MKIRRLRTRDPTLLSAIGGVGRVVMWGSQCRLLFCGRGHSGAAARHGLDLAEKMRED